MSEALILESVNPQYDERLFIDFQEKYKFTTCCVQKLFFWFFLTFKTIFVHNMLWTCIFLGSQWTISRHIVGWLVQEWGLLKKIYLYFIFFQMMVELCLFINSYEALHIGCIGNITKPLRILHHLSKLFLNFG
jgi:hypothetical protein